MNEEAGNSEKDFRSLISQMAIFSDTRDKMIDEIDDILDRLKRNRRPSVSDAVKQAQGKDLEQPDVVTQIRTLIHKMDVANERLQAISNRINELA
jgi:DNA repair ATPase RecN